MESGKLRTIRHAIISGVIRAGTRAPAQAARSARARKIRGDRQEGHGRGATCIRTTKSRTGPKASL
eukprot:5909353-Pyramimonas_sp.AAC.1